MPERRNFLLLAIGMGAIGMVIGVMTLWGMVKTLG